MTDFNPTITPMVYTKSDIDYIKTSLQNGITNLTNSLNAEITDRKRVETEIKNAANQNVFCTTKEGNDIFKEVYIYPYVETINVESIVIERGITTENGSKKYQITFKDSNNKYSYVYLGNSVNAIQGETLFAPIQNNNNEGFGSGKTFYAVIDWSKLPEGGSKTITTNFTSLIRDSKYSPIITHVMQSYKFVNGSLGNAFIRELYLEDLKREEYTDGVLTSTHSYASTPQTIADTFVLSSIQRNVNGKWEINFGAKSGGLYYPFKFETSENPESQEVIHSDILAFIGDGSVQYKAKMYAVVDWSQIPVGTSINYGRPLLGGVVQKKLSPTITNYIEFGNKVVWSESFNLNDYKTQGIYYITGERLQSENDNLPIMNAAPGHSISGQLTVLDASLSDAERCVTQYLKLTNRLGSEGKEYIRTYNKYSNGNESWSAWRELKQTVNLNQISDAELKNYTENGMYEGAIMNGTDVSWIQGAIEKFFADLPMSEGATSVPSGSLFSVEVLNNYAVVQMASQMGIPVERSVTQRARVLLITGQYAEIQRTLQGDVWSGWKMINVL